MLRLISKVSIQPRRFSKQSASDTFSSFYPIKEKIRSRNAHTNGERTNGYDRWSRTPFLGISLIGLAGAAGTAYFFTKRYSANVKDNSIRDISGASLSRQEYTWDEISKHKSVQNGVWVTLGENVYDITTFVEKHPGGNIILLAAGGPLEPFWEKYTSHNTEVVTEILKPMLMGTVAGNRDEDERLTRLFIGSQFIETPAELIVDQFKTPNELFYIRNHMPVPNINKDEYQLTVSVTNNCKSFSFKDLQSNYTKHKFVSTMQCAGNRCEDMLNFQKFSGPSASIGEISNAEWGGVLLKDVFRDLGLNENDPEVKHIIFEGYDTDVMGKHYEISVPKDILLKPGTDALLAYEMNGVELPRDHGYPLRLVIPGVVGARCVKWLKSIKTSQEESTSEFQKRAYRMTPSSATWDNFDFEGPDSHAIYYLPVQSAICTPTDGSTLDADNESITVRGYAYSGAGSDILRVDVSVDGGKTWQSAELLPDLKQKPHMRWAWTRWETTLPIPDGIVSGGKIEICCKALDSNFNVQPETVAGIWNLRAYLSNSWHKVHVNVK